MGIVKRGVLIAAFAAVAVCGALGIKSYLFSGSPALPPSPFSASSLTQVLKTLENPGNLPATTTLPSNFPEAYAIVNIDGSQPSANLACPSQVFSYTQSAYLIPGKGIVRPTNTDSTFLVDPYDPGDDAKGSKYSQELQEFTAASKTHTGEEFVLGLSTVGKVPGLAKLAAECGEDTTPSTPVIESTLKLPTNRVAAARNPNNGPKNG